MRERQIPIMDEMVKNIHHKAIALYKQKKFDDAIRLWQKALEIDPEEIEVLYSLGLINFELKKYDEAIRFLERLLELSPGHFKAMLIIGTAYIKMRKFDLAEEYIQKSIAINPKHKLAFLNLGAIYSVQRKFDRGIEMFEKVVELYPQEPRGYLGLAKIYALLEDAEKANSYFRKVIELDPNGPMGNYAKKAIFVTEKAEKSERDIEQLYAEGYRFFLAGYYRDAASRFEEYLQYRQKDDLVHFIHAEALMRCGETKKSFLAFKRAILSNPKKGLYYKELAILIDKIGKASDVLEVIKKAKELGKNDSIVLYLEGKNLNRLDRFQEAAEVLKAAIKSDKNNLAAYLELAKAYIGLDQPAVAQEQLQFILDHPLETPLKTAANTLMLHSVTSQAGK